MCCFFEVGQNFSPSTVFFCTSPVALVNDNQVKEFRRKLFVRICLFVSPSQSLIQSQIHFIALIYHTVFYNRHFILKVFEIASSCLVNQCVSVSQKQDSFFLSALPKSVDDLKSCVGFSCSSCHHQQNSVLPFGNSFNGSVYRNLLVVSWASSTSVKV